MPPSDDDAGEAGKRDGMERAERHADEHWVRCMKEAGKIVALGKPFFTSDDVVDLCAKMHPNASTHEGRATGPIMGNMARQEWCVQTQDFVRSRRKSCHATPRVVYFSLIYRGPPVPRPRRRRIIDPRQFDLLRED